MFYSSFLRRYIFQLTVFCSSQGNSDHFGDNSLTTIFFGVLDGKLLNQNPTNNSIKNFGNLCTIQRIFFEGVLDPEDYCQGSLFYRKFSEISTALGISATIIHLPNNYWGISPTPDSSKDTFHQMSATQ